MSAKKYTYVWAVLGNYGDGWEVVYWADNKRHAGIMCREYADNMPAYYHRFARVRQVAQ